MTTTRGVTPVSPVGAPSPRVSIVVVSYNTRDLTLSCLASVVRETKEAAYELIVFDNASSDGSADAVRRQFPDLHVIGSAENVGFAEANNRAAAAATGQWLLLLNPDTEILDGAIDRLVAAAEARGEGIYGGRTVFSDGSLNPSSCFGAMTPWSLACRASGISNLFPWSERLNPESYGRWARDSERRVDIVTGCFLLIPMPLWHRLEGFDPEFFMFGEEVDLCLRAAALGVQRRIIPSATIVHHGGASEPVRGRRMSLVFASKVSLMRRHWRPGTGLAGVLMLQLWAGSRTLLLGLGARGNPRLARSAEGWRFVWAARRQWRRGFAASVSRDGSPRNRPAGLTTRLARYARIVWRFACEARSPGDFRGLMRVRLAQSKLGWLVCPRPVVEEVALRSLGPGIHLRSHTTDISVLAEVVVSDGYSALSRVGAQPDTILDLGANTGIVARWLLHRFPHARLLAVEPDSGNAEMLRRNLENVKNRTSIVTAAAGARNRVVGLETESGEHGFRIVERADGESGIDVLTVPELLETAGFERADLLKCDIEGAEDEVFGSCEGWIKRIGSLVVECHQPYDHDRLLHDIDRAGGDVEVLALERNPAYGSEVVIARVR